jgi:cytochrome c551/c552
MRHAGRAGSRVVGFVASALAAASACKRDSEPAPTRIGTPVRAEARIPVGGVLPAANALAAPRPSQPDPEAGATLFASMNCDGCHGGGAVGWVGPSLVDGRWRYGGSDQELFTSIYYGRPKGMPAYGGVIGTDGVWMLIAYLRAQSVPPVVPTTSWLPGGNAAATPPEPTPAGPSSEEKASPSGAEQAKAGSAEEHGSPEQLIGRYGCTGCHAVDHKVVGPAFRDVAARYRGKEVEAALVEKVKQGGAGAWGQVPMTPNPQVPGSTLHRIVQWILALK